MHALLPSAPHFSRAIIQNLALTNCKFVSSCEQMRQHGEEKSYF